jgi:hypothetical protein
MTAPDPQPRRSFLRTILAAPLALCGLLSWPWGRKAVAAPVVPFDASVFDFEPFVTERYAESWTIRPGMTNDEIINEGIGRLIKMHIKATTERRSS